MNPAGSFTDDIGRATGFRPQREKVLFPTNIPVRIQLEDGDGILQTGAYGDQYRYWLTGHKIVWLEPGVHEQIQATTATPYDVYEITKSETRKGTKRNITWHVEQIEDGEQEPPAHVAEAMRDAEPAAAVSLRMPPARAMDTAAAAAAAMAQIIAAVPALSAAPAPGPRLVSEPQTRATLTGQHAAEARITECLLAGIRAAAAAELYAQSQELRIRWTSEDVRAFALSLFISAERTGAAVVRDSNSAGGR